MQELLQPCLRTTFLIKSEVNNTNNNNEIIDNVTINNKTDGINNKVFSNLIYQNGKINVDQWLYKFCKLLLIKIEELCANIKNNYNSSHSRIQDNI